MITKPVKACCGLTLVLLFLTSHKSRNLVSLSMILDTIVIEEFDRRKPV